MVQIGSAQEEAVVSHFLSHIDSQHAVWIGLHDQGHEETFTWTSGETVVLAQYFQTSVSGKSPLGKNRTKCHVTI